MLGVAAVVLIRVSHCGGQHTTSFLEQRLKVSAFRISIRKSEEIFRGGIHVANMPGLIDNHHRCCQQVETCKSVRFRRHDLDVGVSKIYATNVARCDRER